MLGIGFFLLFTQAWGQGSTSLEDSVEAAIGHAVGYFASHEADFAPDAYLMYHFLHRKFQIGLPVSEAEFMNQLVRSSPHYAEVKPFLRILRKTSFHRSFLKPKGLLNDITLAGIWYDHLQDRSELEHRILAMDFDNDYNITHAYLALFLAHQCFSARNDTHLVQRLLVRMVELAIPAEDFLCDVHIEAIAFLYFTDHSQFVPLGSIRKILAQQNPDGGWVYCPSTHPRDSQHTTVLALWALLEFHSLSHPFRDVPFIMLK